MGFFMLSLKFVEIKKHNSMKTIVESYVNADFKEVVALRYTTIQ